MIVRAVPEQAAFDEVGVVLKHDVPAGSIVGRMDAKGSRVGGEILRTERVDLLAPPPQVHRVELAGFGLAESKQHLAAVFGNVTDGEAEITVNRRTVRVGPGVGAKKPDGPMLDLAPGKYEVSFKTAGKPAQRETVTVGKDETWGVLIGPGGALPLQAY